jgi:glycerol-3-phosphate acyltransferase PlsY
MGKYKAGIDIRKYGSGNAGATNTLRVLGKKAAAVVFLADALKGVFAVGFGSLLTGGSDVGMVAAGVASIAGHNWPIFLGFRGGKGVATTIGVLLTLAFLPAICAGVIAILVLIVTRIVSLASLVFVTLLPFFILFFHRPWVFFIMALLMAVMMFWRHRTNIQRILQGKENRLGR